METIRVTQENVDKEHICCALSGAEAEDKKAWMQQRFDDGLVFLKSTERGKVFVEYMPAEQAWRPIDAPNYMHINCFWVAGKFQGQGYARELMEQCIADAKAKGKDGLVALTGTRNQAFLTDPKFFAHFGFQVADTAPPYFQLMYLPFRDSAATPRFKECVSDVIDERGFVLFVTNQCPFAEKYGKILRSAAEQHGKAFALHKLETKQQAQHAPTPFTTYSLYYDGKFVTNEILSEKKFLKMFEKELGVQ